MLNLSLAFLAGLLMGAGRILPSLFVLLAVIFFSGPDILSWMRRNGL